jgi:hypothetical protein
MASHTISGQPWPDGTSVSVYPAAQQPDPTQAPSGVAVTSAAVSAGQVTFTGLLEQLQYVAWASGRGRRFLVPAAGSSPNAPSDRARIATLEVAVAAVESVTVVAAAPTGVAARDGANLAAAFASVVAAGAGTVILPPGEYLVDTTAGPILDWPVAKVIRVRGAGMSSSGNIFGTRITRTAGTAPIMRALGTGQNTSQRVYPEIEDVGLSGNALGSELLTISRATHAYVNNLRISNCAGTGVRFTEVWDSRIPAMTVETCGTAETDPACVFDSFVGGGSQGGCATVHGGTWVFQSNHGTDLRLTGSAADGSACHEVGAAHVKMEGTGSTATFGSPDVHPYIDLDYAQNCQFGSVKISMPTGRACTAFVQQMGTSAGTRANQFANLVLDVAGTNVPVRYIDWRVGTMQIGNLSIPTTQPTTEYIGLRGSAGRFSVGAINHNSTAPYSGFMSDFRTVNEELSKGHVAANRLSGTAPAGTLAGSSMPCHDFVDASTTDWAGQAEVPRDAHPSGQARIRLYWVTTAVTGDCHWRVITKCYGPGDDTSVAGTTFDLVSTAAATSLGLVVATFASGPTSLPSGVMPVYVQRVGAAGDDTLAATARLVRVEVIYDKRV